MFFNGYYSACCVSNIFGFLPTGELFEACVNWPGSWHDSRVCRDAGVYDRMFVKCRGFRIICDSAFPTSKQFSEFILRCPKKNERESVDKENWTQQQRDVYSALSSARQSAEWGVGALQQSFPRLILRHSLDTVKRFDHLMTIVYLYQLRTRTVGRNEIRTVFVVNNNV